MIYRARCGQMVPRRVTPGQGRGNSARPTLSAIVTISDDWQQWCVSEHRMSGLPGQSGVVDTDEDRPAPASPELQESNRSGLGVILNDLNNLGVDVAGAAVIAVGGMIAGKLHNPLQPPSEPLPPWDSQPPADPAPEA
jgi:hypothetical protein